MRDSSGVTLKQIIERARNRAEKPQHGGYPRFLAYRTGDGPEGGERLALSFFGRKKINIAYHGEHGESKSMFLPLKAIDRADEVSSGDDPAAQWLALHRLIPTAPTKLLNLIVRLWEPWVLKFLDLWEGAE